MSLDDQLIEAELAELAGGRAPGGSGRCAEQGRQHEESDQAAGQGTPNGCLSCEWNRVIDTHIAPIVAPPHRHSS